MKLSITLAALLGDFLIALNNKTGYHQIAVRYPCRNQEKLAIFAPGDLKWCFGVVSFGPQNAPAFYTYMMQIFKSK